MPTYEYACDSCGLFEAFQSMREDAYKICPQCKGKKIQRVISGGAGVIFKGDGFWETDYNRSEDYKKQSKTEASVDSDKSEDSAKSTGSEKSKETKKVGSDAPASKAQAKPLPSSSKKPSAKNKSRDKK
ncbi:MAG: zinc ribbon domain-containing protein [Planctomycetes bacterium]|nr:zinc ribbon domain-containing protein [Planctomycetota bacterium]